MPWTADSQLNITWAGTALQESHLGVHALVSFGSCGSALLSSEDRQESEADRELLKFSTQLLKILFVFHRVMRIFFSVVSTRLYRHFTGRSFNILSLAIHHRKM
jgi:hypothetical protein